MILAAGLAQLPEKLGRSGVAASRAWQGLDHNAPNRHDIGSTTARSIDEVALIRGSITAWPPLSTIEMTTSQLFCLAFASAAAIAFLA